MPENAGTLSQFFITIGANNFAGADGKPTVTAGNRMNFT
jgi:hypothetical protein